MDQNELQEIEKYVIEIYQKNLNFLEEHFFDIFQEVESLSQDIESGNYKETYSLEIVNGYFDIKNLENGGFYYATNSYKDAEGRANYNDFSAESSWNLLRQSSNGEQLIKSQAYEDVLPIVDYINEKVDLKYIQFKEIFKMVFIGVGLGFHINEIYKKLQPKNILIIESEIEIFRLSLFTMDYSAFIGPNRKLFLSIGDDKKLREKQYHEFYAYQEFLNFNVKYYKLLKNHDYIKEELSEFFSLNYAGQFPYKLVLYNLHITLDLMKKHNSFLNQKKIYDNNPIDQEKVLLISAGPSVDNYIEWIQGHQDKFIIICVDVILKKLEKNKIVPDIVVSIDPHALCADYLTVKDPEFLKNSAIIFLSQQHEKTLETVKELNTYFTQSVPIIDELGYLGTLPNVGSFSFSIALQLGAKELFLIGNDAAFNQETGERYSKDSAWFLVDPLENKASSEDKLTVHDVLEVKGNLRETVKTNRKLYSFKKDYEGFLASFDLNKYHIYNLSDGAFIEGMIPMLQSELTQLVENDKSIEKNILEKLDKVSEKIESFDFEIAIKVINSVLRKITKYKKMTFKNRDDFLQNKLDLMIWTLEQTKKTDNGVIPNLFLMFTALADIYINFILNLEQKGLHTKEEINQIAKMWLDGMYNLFKDIKKALVL